MNWINSFKVDDIDYGLLCKELESKAEFKDATWEGHVSSVLKGMSEIQEGLVDASKKLSEILGRDSDNLGDDGPTDVIWTISIILVTRTIGMLSSKSRDFSRTGENREAHKRLLKRYIRILCQLSEKEDEIVALFPYTQKSI